MDRKGFYDTKWDCVPHSLQADGNSCGVFVCKVCSGYRLTDTGQSGHLGTLNIEYDLHLNLQ